MATWRKNREGSWVVFGPASEILPDTWVSVSKKDGSTSRTLIATTSRPFDVNGVPHVYGTPAPRESGVGTSSQPRQSGGEYCAECGSRQGPFRTLPDSSGIMGPCCPRCQRTSRYERSYA